MPFLSQRQLQTCYGKKLSAEARGEKYNWDCDKWLKETKDPLCLPTTKSSKKPKKMCRTMKKSEKMGKLIQGPRGGYYFYAGGVKVYVPKNALTYAKKKYGVKKV